MNDDYLLKFFVEFFINNSINEFNKYCLEVGDIQRMITPIIFSKYKYNDLRMDMGLYGIFFQRFNCTSIEIDRKPMANINHSNPKNLTIKNKLHELRKLTKIHQN